MTEKSKKQSKSREKLLKAGIKEISKYGISNFSMRRVAKMCGVTSGAPYKHFKDKREFVAAIIEYVNEKWRKEEQLPVLEAFKDNTREQIVEISIRYVKFLVKNPHFRSILMLKDNEFDNIYHKLRGEMSSVTQVLIERYCKEVNMKEEVRFRKQYVVRALIFGAAIMFDNGEMEYNEKNLELVKRSISREFDLP